MGSRSSSAAAAHEAEVLELQRANLAVAEAGLRLRQADTENQAYSSVRALMLLLHLLPVWV